MSSGLRLAVPEPESALEDTDRDGALQAWEMFSLPLQAELVVLSACESGLGEKVPGEGLVGFTWALQAAGARSLVASQWQVEDRSTQSLMVALHQGLRRGLAKDEALRQAMRKLAQGKDWPHPYHWSGFLLLGDPRNNGLSAPN
jgi:CHAT domain-containing protein